ncbi:hypothetical protein BN946_scf184875.g7 [Trametes cinnabarina]|uniref:Uncharacterized protein n=1 Tax=Pycnoporus cinnabarinus TaxID=5643 RepID=A0A060SBD7_PYCCI|nr:hypothetical protein BN946_scf184875.g7 [Trametes cinnabarina]
MITFTDIMKAAFTFVFGLQLENLPPAEDESKHARALDWAPTLVDREWEVAAFPQPFFSLTGQIPAHIISAWR